MTDLKKQIKSFSSLVIPDEIRKNVPLIISVKDRNLPSAQKQLIFEETILKDYKKVMVRKRLTWLFSSAVILMFVLPIGLCTMKSHKASSIDGYDSLMSDDMTAEVSVITDLGTFASESDLATITLTDTHIILNGRDSVRHDATSINRILVPDGKRAVVKLNDNTKISINEESRLGIPSCFSRENRIVFFSGKASFNVNHDELHPFLVDAKIVKAHVLGTEFSINTNPESDNFASVALYNGRLEVELPGIETSVSLEPSEAVILKGQNFMKMNEIPSNMRKNCYTEIFELDGSMKSLIDKISEFYGLTVLISGDFEDIECHGRIIFTDRTEEFLDMLTYLFPVQYRYIDNNKLLLIKTN